MGIGSKIKEILDFKGIKQKKFAEMINSKAIVVLVIIDMCYLKFGWRD